MNLRNSATCLSCGETYTHPDDVYHIRNFRSCIHCRQEKGWQVFTRLIDAQKRKNNKLEGLCEIVNGEHREFDLYTPTNKLEVDVDYYLERHYPVDSFLYSDVINLLNNGHTHFIFFSKMIDGKYCAIAEMLMDVGDFMVKYGLEDSDILPLPIRGKQPKIELILI